MKVFAMLKWANRAETDMTGFSIIGNPDDRRITLFSKALHRLGLPPAQIIRYYDLLTGQVSLADCITPGSIVRIESPGHDFEIERLLLHLGNEAEDAEEGNYERLSRREINTLTFDKGRILSSRQWYLGYSQLLTQMEQQLAPIQHRLMNTPANIRLMFDKRACYALLASHGIIVPETLPPVQSYDELLAAMRQRGLLRAFIKIAHGSSASGVVAFRMDRTGTRQQAITTAEMVHTGQQTRLYNSRRLHTYQNHHEIATLINALCRQRVHVEAWWPKASFAGKVFDLRILTIAGHARHAVARLSHSPLTNLHLRNERVDAATIQTFLGKERWQTALHECEQAARLFESLYIGVDLLFSHNLQHHAILELNAFGDLLLNVLYQNQDTYTTEIQAMLTEVPCSP